MKRIGATRSHQSLGSFNLEKECIESILEASEIGLWDWDIHNDVILWDAKCYEILGYAPDAFSLNYETWVNLLHHDNAKIAQEEVRRQLKVGETFSVQFQLRKNDSTYAWIEGLGRVVERRDDGTPKRMVGTHINKTKEKEKDEQINCQHRLFSEFMDNSTVLIVIKDLFGRYQFINPVWEELTGLSAQYVIGKTDQEIFPEAIATCFMENDAQVLLKGKLIEVEEYLDAPDGRRYFDAVKFPLKDEKGAISGVCAMVSDITERKKAEALLLANEQRLSSIIKGTNAGTWEWNVQTGEAIFNERWAEMIGYTLEELAPIDIQTWLNLAHPDDLEAARMRLEEHFSGELDYYESEIRVRHKNGSWVWVLNRGKVASWDDEHRPLWIYGTNRDVTHEKHKKAELANVYDQLGKIFENNAAGIFVIDDNRDIVILNQHLCEMLGYTKEELVGKNASFLHVSQEAYNAFAPNFLEAKAGHEAEIEYLLKHKDGKPVWFELHGSAMELHNHRKGVIWNVLDISKRKKIEEALVQSEAQFKSLVDNIPGVTYRCLNDASWTMLYVSHEIDSLSGYLSSDFLHNAVRSYESVIYTDDVVRIRGEIAEAIEKKSDWNIEYRILARDGSIKWVHEKAKAVFNEEGEVLFIDGFILDITEEKHSKEALIQSEQKFKQYIEIRTPMNAIIGLSELMGDTELSSKQSEYLEKIMSSSALLLGIINDVLDFSKIEAGKIEIENTPVYLKNVLMHLRTIFEESASKKGVHFGLNIHDAVPSIVLVDELKLVQILNNFLSNAFKFTTQGSVILSVELIYKNDEHATLRFGIDDTGIGISQVQLEKLFIPFDQADVSITRKYGGTGLGLSIAKRLAEAMGGGVGVVSHEGGGSSFYFELECEVLEWEHILLNTRPSPKENKDGLEGLHVLVVDDNSINQEVVKAILERVGIDVELANNGEEGISCFLRERFDAILMDIQMPVMGGYEATRQIREHDKNIPIIALTAAATAEDKKKALDAGMDEHLAKPLHSKMLYELLEALCVRTNRTSIKENVVDAQTPTNGAIDPNHVHVMFDGDTLLFQKLLIHFGTQLDGEFKSIVESVRNNRDDAPVLIHKLKGVSGNLGAFALAGVCTRIDACYKQKHAVEEALVLELQQCIEALNIELTHLEREEVAAMSDDAIHSALMEFKKRLEEADLIEPCEQASLVKALAGKIDKKALKQWDEAVEALDYAKALRVMQTWDMPLLERKR